MVDDRQVKRGFLSRSLHSWQAPVLLGFLILIGLFVWMARVKLIVFVDGSGSFDAKNGPSSREIAWEPAKELGQLLPEQPENTELITPRLTDSGATLYFTRRQEDGKADIYRARLEDGDWESGVAVDALNTEHDEIGPVVSHDGKHMYFYSNRPGGEGGYDIYVSGRTPDGWSEPQNLGPKVNTKAHEYDPAIAPDELSLFFASNRTDELHEQSKNENDKFQPWTTTLRARLGKTKFDLYMSQRPDVDATWQPAVALADLNRLKSDEGAPFMSPNGAFLYFASDRPFRSGEDSNLDLYRARRVGDRFQEPENLGTSINTANHETEPALSPEGYTLVFSSDRAGNDRLYISTAGEIYEDTNWRAKLPVISGIWWRALLISLVCALLLAALLFFRGLLTERAYAARFFLSSVIIHVLLLLLLAYWTLPTVVEMIVTELYKDDSSTQLLDDNEHQSHEDGREAYEKVNDLQALEQVPVPQVQRQVTEANSMPERTKNLLQTIPLQAARQLPPERVLFIPTKQTKTVPEPPKLTRQKVTLPRKPLEIAEVTDELLTEKSAKPVETPVQAVELTQQEQTATAQVAPARPLLRTSAVVPRVTAVELDEVRPIDQPKLPRTQPTQLAARRPILEVKSVKPISDDVPVQTAKASAAVESKLAATPTNVAKTSATTVTPTTTPQPVTPPRLRAPLPRSVPLQNVAPKQPLPASPTRTLAPRTARPLPEAGVAVTEEEAVAIAKASDAPAKLMVRKTTLELKKTVAVTPKAGIANAPVLPRQSPRPVSAQPVELAAVTDSVQPTPDNTAKTPLPKLQRSRPAAVRTVTDVDDDVAPTAKVETTTETQIVAAQTQISKSVETLITPTTPAKPVVNLPRLKTSMPKTTQLAVAVVELTDDPRQPEAKLQRKAELVKTVADIKAIDEAVVTLGDAAPVEKAVEQAKLKLARNQTFNPRLVANAPASIPRQLPRVTTARPIELAAATNPLPAELATTPKAAVDRQRSTPAQPAAEVVENIVLTAATLENTDDNPVPKTITVTRVTPVGPRPTKPLLNPLNQPRPLQVRADVIAALSPSELPTRPDNSNEVRNDVSRLAATPVDPNQAAQADSNPNLKLTTAATPGESPLAKTTIQFAQTDAGLPQFDVKTPQELTGPARRNKHKIVVGAVSEQRNDAAPSFGPMVSRLARPRARATRVAYAEDNVGIRSMFLLRQGSTRRQFIELLGGTDESEKAVNRGLEWLAKHQEQDGSWDLKKHQGSVKSNSAGTGFGLLPFLAAGHTHSKPGKYQKNVQAAVDWLLEHQKDDGDLFAKGDGQHMYSHGIAAIALCEAYGMSEDPKLKQPAQKALDFIVKAQHAGSGGWRYNPQQSGDTSVVGWQMMALKSGEMAGLSVPAKTYQNLRKWLKSVEATGGGRFGYTSKSPSPAMTAEGLLSLQFLGIDRNDPRMRNGADYLLAYIPKEKQSLTSYYWYYGTQVMYHMQGKYWQAWNEKFRDMLVKTQTKSGGNSGTWDPRDQWEKSGGRIMSTSLKLLMLEVYYRHLPLYEQLED